MADTDVLRETARAACSRRDWREAYRCLDEARGCCELDTDELDALGEAAWWLGIVKDALCTSEEVFRRLQQAGSTRRAGMKAVELGLAWITRGDIAIGSGWINRAKRILAEVPEGPEHGYLGYLDAMLALEFGDLEPTTVQAPALQQMSSRYDAPALESLGLVLSGLADLKECRTVAGFAKLDEAMLPVLADQVPPLWATDVYCTVIHACHLLADVRRMRSWTDALERWSANVPQAVMVTGICRIHRLQLRGFDGDFEVVERLLIEASEALTDLNGWIAGAGFHQLGDVRRMRGDTDQAMAAYARARELGIEPQPGEALLQLATGKGAAAWTMLRSALDCADRVGRARLLPSAVLVALSLDKVDEAETCCQELESLAEAYWSPGFRAWARHCRGAVLVTRRAFDEGLRALQAAARDYREQQTRYSLAQVYEWMALAHKGIGDNELADADVATALAIYRQLGAEPDVRRLDRSERPGGLTAREVEILACIAQGATNKQVAAQVFITEKTVGRHLANIYAKLGVSSRTAAVAWARANALV